MTDADITSEDFANEAASLEFSKFDESSAVLLGTYLVGFAKADGLPIVINVRTADRTLFHAALPGSAPLNDAWARRKSNVALMFQKSSLQVGMEMQKKGTDMKRDGLSEADFAVHGGSVPIRVKGVGVVAAVTVSGLPQRDDHALAVRGLKALMHSL